MTIKFGCHCDLEEHMTPDGCVIDNNKREDCLYARKHDRKEECEYWKPITFTPATPSTIPDGMTLVRTDVVRFLCGMAELDGLWFGEDHPTESGDFWWRSRLPSVSDLCEKKKGAK